MYGEPTVLLYVNSYLLCCCDSEHCADAMLPFLTAIVYVHGPVFTRMRVSGRERCWYIESVMWAAVIIVCESPPVDERLP